MQTNKHCNYYINKFAEELLLNILKTQKMKKTIICLFIIGIAIHSNAQLSISGIKDKIKSKTKKEEKIASTGNDQNTTTENNSAKSETALTYNNELNAEPLFKPSWSSSYDGLLSNAQKQLDEFKNVKTNPSSRKKSDEAMLLDLFYSVNTCYANEWYKNETHKIWEEARKIKLEIPANTGDKDELLYKEFRQAGANLSELQQFCDGILGGAYNPQKSLDVIKSSISNHELTNLKGQKSLRGQALIKEAEELIAKNKSKFTEQTTSVGKVDAYNKDAEVIKLKDDWKKLNINAEAVAKKIGEKNPVDWAHSTQPSLASYKQTLTQYQQKDNKLRAKYGMD